jgi:hypothetical protein
MCGGENMVGLVPYIKEGKVDNNIVIIIQEVGGVVKIFRFMGLLLSSSRFEKSKRLFLNCVFQNGGFLNILERARRIFCDANILLTEKSWEQWSFTYQFARCWQREDFKNDENHLPVDLIGMTFIRGYVYLSGLHIKILSHLPSVGKENVDKLKLGEFKEKFFDEIKSDTDKYKDDEERYWKLFMLFSSSSDYVNDDLIFKDLFKPFDDRLLERFQKKPQEELTNRNLNNNSGSVPKRCIYEPIEETSLRLLGRLLKSRNGGPDASTGEMKDTQSHEAQCSYGGKGQNQGTAPLTNNRGGRGAGRGSGKRRINNP